MYKDYAVVAQIINQWDLVALSEMIPVIGELLKFNNHAIKAYRNKTITLAELRQSYFQPGYLKLLRELRKLDPSWGLLLTSVGQSSVSELYGFFYRSSTVMPEKSQYCQDFACLLALKNQPFARQYFSRIPFVANFRAQKKTFSLVTLHSRFRTPGESDPEKPSACSEDCKRILSHMIQEIVPETAQLPWIDDSLLKKIVNNKPLPPTQENLPEVKKAKELPLEMLKTRLEYTVEKEDVPRFYEALAVVAESKEIERANGTPVIIAGDFNLEYFEKDGDATDAEQKNMRLWKRALLPHAGTKVLVNHQVKTSISQSTGPLHNYDHFIMSASALPLCDVTSAGSVDFIKELDYPNSLSATKISALKAEKLQELEAWRLVSNDLQLKPLRDIHADGKIRNCYTGTSEPGSMLDKLYMGYQCQVFYESFEKTGGYKYLVFHALVSDHLPIQMNCFN